MRLGIYIGSFNPPHEGHKKVMNYLLSTNFVDKILVVPTLNYWDKQDLLPIDDRINMLKFYENENILIDKEHNQYPYTIDLMKKLHEKYPKDELYLIIGADNLIHFDKWKEYQELLKYPIIVMNRNDINLSIYLKKYPKHHFLIAKDFKPLKVSSTEIRKNLNNKYLDKRIKDYLQEHHLF